MSLVQRAHRRNETDRSPGVTMGRDLGAQLPCRTDDVHDPRTSSIAAAVSAEIRPVTIALAAIIRTASMYASTNAGECDRSAER
jgi:hypothetical protein